MKPRAITARLLKTGPHRMLSNALLLLNDGVIERITTQQETQAPADTLHLGNRLLLAGFLDVHVHGAGGRDVMEGSIKAVHTAARTMARHGTTRFLATTVTAPLDHTFRALAVLADVIEAPAVEGAARPIGIHLEGPFLSHAKRGVHPPEHLQRPSVELFDRMQQAARGHIRLLTIAPEIEGALDLIAHAAAAGVRVSMGHSDAFAVEARAGIEAARGAAPSQAVSATHTFNAMRTLDHREPGILGVVLDDKDLYAELICDGIHTTPEAVRLWDRAKRPERGILVTDGMAATGMPDGDYKLGELDVVVKDGVCMSGGVLAGSVLTMDRAVTNFARFTGKSIKAAHARASQFPAAMLGLPDHRKVLAPGDEASFTIFDAADKFCGTVLRGEYLPAV